MKKPNIINGPFSVTTHGSVFGKEGGEFLCSTAVTSLGHMVEKRHDHAIAIATALNETYGKNIDPTKIDQVLEGFKHAIAKFKEMHMTGGDTEFYEKLLKNLYFE